MRKLERLVEATIALIIFLWYATYVIKGRWPKGEAILSTCPYYAYYYAIDIMKERWPEAEGIIFSNPYYLRDYREKFL